MSSQEILHGTTDGVLQHQALGVPIEDCSCKHVVNAQNLEKSMIAIQDLVGNATRTKVAMPVYKVRSKVMDDMARPILKPLFDERNSRIEAGEDADSVGQETTSRARQIYESLWDKLPRLPKTINWTRGYRQTIVTPQEHPKMSTKQRESLLQELEMARESSDPDWENYVQSNLQQKRVIPSESGLSSKKLETVSSIRAVKKEIARRRRKDPEDSTAQELEHQVTQLQSQFDETDWGPARKELKDPTRQEFEDKKEVLGRCSDSQHHIGFDLFIPNSDLERDDPERNAHLEKMVGNMCRSCPLEEECHRHQVITEDQNSRGPSTLRDRFGVRKKLRVLLDNFQIGKPPRLAEVLDPRRAKDVANGSSNLVED